MIKALGGRPKRDQVAATGLPLESDLILRCQLQLVVVPSKCHIILFPLRRQTEHATDSIPQVWNSISRVPLKGQHGVVILSRVRVGSAYLGII